MSLLININSRIGISTEPEREHVILPSNLNDLIEQFDINERDHGTTWEFVFNTSYGEESREKMLLDSSFVMETELMTKNDFISDPQSIAESALKVWIRFSIFSLSLDIDL